MKRSIRHERSSGNVFADIEIRYPKEALAKAKIATRIRDVIEEKKLTQKEAAIVLDTDQPRISDLICGRLRRFSMDKLFHFLNALDQDIEIVLRNKSKNKKEAEIRVLAA